MVIEKEYTGEEIAARGEAVYDAKLRQILDVPENRGKVVAVDIDSGDYAVGRRSLDVVTELQARRPEAFIYILRVGYPAAISIGGGFTR